VGVRSQAVEEGPPGAAFSRESSEGQRVGKTSKPNLRGTKLLEDPIRSPKRDFGQWGAGVPIIRGSPIGTISPGERESGSIKTRTIVCEWEIRGRAGRGTRSGNGGVEKRSRPLVVE